MSENGVVTTAHTLTIDHIAMFASHAKDSGMNKSEALRDILDDWARMKRGPVVHDVEQFYPEEAEE